MIKLDQFKDLNFNITWTLLLKCILKDQIAMSDVAEYASEQLEMGDDRTEVCELAWGDISRDSLIGALYYLSSQEKNDDFLEEKKIAIILLWEFLQQNDNDYISGLTKLVDIWIQLGCPENFPHSAIKNSELQNTDEYYTEDNYNDLLIASEKWMKNEIYAIIKNQSAVRIDEI